MTLKHLLALISAQRFHLKTSTIRLRKCSALESPLSQIVKRLSGFNVELESSEANAITQRSFKRPNYVFQAGDVFVVALERVSQDEVHCRIYSMCHVTQGPLECSAQKMDPHTQVIPTCQLEKEATVIHKEDSANCHEDFA